MQSVATPQTCRSMSSATTMSPCRGVVERSTSSSSSSLIPTSVMECPDARTMNAAAWSSMSMSVRPMGPS